MSRPNAEIVSLRYKGPQFLDFSEFSSSSIVDMPKWTKESGTLDFLFNGKNTGLLKKGVEFPVISEDDGLDQKSLPSPFFPAQSSFWAAMESQFPTMLIKICKISSQFGCKNVRDLRKTCLIAQTCILADCIVEYPKFLKHRFCMYFAHFSSLAYFSYESCLYNSSERIQIINDPEMIEMVDRAITGGI
jgi:hypothetical protein